VEKECEESHDQVDALESALMKQGLGVAGESATRQALEHGYADVLIIDQDYSITVREELVRLALQSDAEIETVKDSEKLKRLEGVGCLLRYRPAYVDQPVISATS
jgi:peptide subunit release factor 1 (eRF1)